MTMKYPPKEKYEFIHVQDAVGLIGTSLLGDYKEWSDDSVKQWVESMIDEYGKLAAWRIWVSQKFKELESSLLEPDWGHRCGDNQRTKSTCRPDFQTWACHMWRQSRRRERGIKKASEKSLAFSI